LSEDQTTGRSTRIFRKSRQLVTREIAEETILVPIKGELASLQQIFVLNPVAAYIWEQIDGARDLRAIHAGILESFEVGAKEARDDLAELIDALEEAGLVERVASAEPTTDDAAT
jgi:hypothetical protein